jgi:hypothetical protein
MATLNHPSSVLATHLFWDIRAEILEWDKHKKTIIERVLQRGSLAEWKTIVSVYGLDVIVEVVKGLRTLDPVDLNFIATLSNTPLNAFRCYHTRSLTRRHWDY